MDMKYTEEQKQLQDLARRYLEKECTIDFVRNLEKKDEEIGFSKEMWASFAEMGWLGLAIPEEHDGMGWGLVDQAILAMQMGRSICPSPYLSTAVIAAEAIVLGGTDDQKSELLEEIIGGEAVYAFCFQENTREFGPKTVALEAKADGDNYVINGSKMFVEFSKGADKLLVVTRTAGKVGEESGLTMFIMDSDTKGITHTHLPTMARERQYEVKFENVTVPKSAVLGPVGDGWTILNKVVQKAAVIFSAYCAGTAEVMHEYALEFSKERVQFGRIIGQMQVIQQYLATCTIEIYGARTIVLYTAWHMDQGRDMLDYVAKTKAFTSHCVEHICDRGSQIFGGMGYIEETPTTLHLRRGKQYQLSMGGMAYWEDIVAEKMFGPVTA